MHDVGHLGGVVIALDIDNTLLDGDATSYQRTVTEFLSFTDTGLDRHEAFAAYELLRSRGDALARLGLVNPIHQRGPADALAVFSIDNCRNPALGRDLGISDDDRRLSSEVVSCVTELLSAAGRGSPEDRLKSEIELRRFCRDGERPQRFRETVRRIAAHPLLMDWARTYDDIERGQSPVRDFRPLLTSLAGMGATLAIISEGREDVQREKLDRLGITDLFERHILVTEAASEVIGAGELEQAVSCRINSDVPVADLMSDGELSLLWYYVCLIDCWGRKTPYFYSRCLHAISCHPDDPEAGLREIAFGGTDHWREKPLRLVMIGDRYDKDVLPLIELLGPDVGLTVRLVQGKYGHLDPESELPALRRPSRAYSDWDSLSEFLTGELLPDDIKPITTPPDLIRRAEIRDDYIKRGLESELVAVHTIAKALAAMIAC